MSNKLIGFMVLINNPLFGIGFHKTSEQRHKRGDINFNFYDYPEIFKPLYEEDNCEKVCYLLEDALNHTGMICNKDALILQAKAILSIDPDFADKIRNSRPRVNTNTPSPRG